MATASFLGLDAVGWAGASAFATILGVAAALATLWTIREQLAMSRRVHVEGLLERGNAALNVEREELLELLGKTRRKEDFSWEDLRAMRRVAIAYESFLPLVQLARRESSAGEFSTIARKYHDDIKRILSLIGESLNQNSRRLQKLKSDGLVALEHFFDEWAVEESDRPRGRELFLDDNDNGEYSVFITALKTKFYAARGRSAAEIAKVISEKNDAVEEGDGENVAHDVLAYRGGDVANATALAAWQIEHQELIDRLKTMNDALSEMLKRDKKSEAVHA